MGKFTKRSAIRLVLLLPVLMAAESVAQIARPNSVWFNKVIGMDRSRQLCLALNSNMWVMYDLPQGVLFQAWQGGSSGGGFVSGGNLQNVTPQYWFFTGSPQFPHVYRPSGTDYFKDSVAEYFASYTPPSHINTTTYYVAGKWPRQPISSTWGGPYKSWTVRNNNGEEVASKLRYRGFTVTPGNVLTLKYGLILANNAEISISEYPEYSNQPSGNRIVRTFTFSGIPTSFQVRQEKLGGANPSVWSVTSGSATIQAGAMVQTANGQTVLTGTF